MNDPIIKVKDFFNDLFPDSYCCALDKTTNAQFAGSIPSNHCQTDESANRFFEETYFGLNKQGHNIHFAPNAITRLEDRNKKENLKGLNACFLDLDIEDSKTIRDEADLWCRQETKERILSFIFNLPTAFWPTLSIDTRNGMHLYWCLDRTEKAVLSNWEIIQRKLLTLFSQFGVDPGTTRPLSMLRVPYFWFQKNGEIGQILPDPYFSDPARKFKETELLAWLDKVTPFSVAGNRPRINNIPKVDLRPSSALNLYTGGKPGIWKRAKALPVQEMLSKLSGHPAVNGEVFSLHRTGPQKFNVLANGKGTPNFIDVNTNSIFSLTEARFHTIIDFMMWYGKSKSDVLQALKELKV